MKYFRNYSEYKTNGSSHYTLEINPNSVAQIKMKKIISLIILPSLIFTSIANAFQAGGMAQSVIEGQKLKKLESSKQQESVKVFCETSIEKLNGSLQNIEDTISQISAPAIIGGEMCISIVVQKKIEQSRNKIRTNPCLDTATPPSWCN